MMRFFGCDIAGAFDGALPKPGEKVEFFCVRSDETGVVLKLRRSSSENIEADPWRPTTTSSTASE